MAGDWIKHEEFRDITGWPEYQVSNFGRIKSVSRVVRGKQGPRKHVGRILKPFGVGKSREYLGVVLCDGGKIKRARVHVLVANAFIGDCPDGYEVDHRDFDTKNNCAQNLRYLPIGVNRGTRKRGNRNGD
jgi:hypothetical protein